MHDTTALHSASWKRQRTRAAWFWFLILRVSIMSAEKDKSTEKDKNPQPKFTDLPEPPTADREAGKVKGGRMAATLAEEGDQG